MKPMFDIDVLYIGSSLPLETASGLDAFRIPLQERYTVVNNRLVGIESVLAVHDTGIQVFRYGSGSSSSSWFPIQNLHACAGLRASRITTGGLDFNWIGSETEDVSHPPVFAFISRHTRGLKILECHLFACKSEAGALYLVDFCSVVYSNWWRWSNDRVSFEGDTLSNSTAAVSTDAHPRLNEYNHGYSDVSLSGFVYGDNMESAPKYNIDGNDGWIWSSKCRSQSSTSLICQRDICHGGAITDGSNQHLFIPVRSLHENEKSKDKKASKWSKAKKKSESSGGKKTEEGKGVIEYNYIRPCFYSAGFEDGSHNGDFLWCPVYPRTVSYYGEDCAQYAPRNNSELNHYKQYALEDYTRPREYLASTSTRPSGSAGVACIVVPEYDQFRLVAAETLRPIFVPLTLEAGAAKRTEDVAGNKPKEIRAEIDFVGANGQRHVAQEASLGSDKVYATRSESKILTDAVSSHQNDPSRKISDRRRSAAIDTHGSRPPSPIPDYPMDENDDHSGSSVPQHREIESFYAVPLKRQGARPPDNGLSAAEADLNTRRQLLNGRSHETGLRAEEDTRNELPTSQQQQQRNQKYVQLIQELGYMP